MVRMGIWTEKGRKQCVCGGQGGRLYSPPEIKCLHKFPSDSSDVQRMFRCFNKLNLLILVQPRSRSINFILTCPHAHFLIEENLGCLAGANPPSFQFVTDQVYPPWPPVDVYR